MLNQVTILHFFDLGELDADAFVGSFGFFCAMPQVVFEDLVKFLSANTEWRPPPFGRNCAVPVLQACLQFPDSTTRSQPLR